MPSVMRVALPGPVPARRSTSTTRTAPLREGRLRRIVPAENTFQIIAEPADQADPSASPSDCAVHKPTLDSALITRTKAPGASDRAAKSGLAHHLARLWNKAASRDLRSHGTSPHNCLRYHRPGSYGGSSVRHECRPYTAQAQAPDERSPHPGMKKPPPEREVGISLGRYAVPEQGGHYAPLMRP